DEKNALKQHTAVPGLVLIERKGEPSLYHKSSGFLSLGTTSWIKIFFLCSHPMLQEEQKYIETVELESYDKCQDLRALLKRKNRFILIRSPGKKGDVFKSHPLNVTFSPPFLHFKVKVDETLSLDHVTRDRVKVGHGRRPPTRIHLKEAANATSDGILRLDLDIVDNGPPELTSTVNENDDVPEESKGPAGDNKENLMEVSNKSHTNAPVPPPKILSEKLKGISWDESALPPQSTEGPKSSMGGSKENITEVVTTDTLKPQVPPKILSERLISANPVLSTSEVKSSESQEPDESTRPVNAMEDGEQEITEVPSKEKTLLPESLGNSSPIRTRCASLGELMDESKNAQKAPADPGCQEETLAKMEEKVACERDKTEKLLQKVLHGELEQAQEGNGPPVNAETILNEAVEQLRQATQVLQEIKGLEELSKEQTEKPKEKQKDLVTLYRRSVP
uniref:Pleckstrin homology domain containing O2 n=1 Tax=Pelusios castaneus TaxID=367368 RepID=A0A8C8STA5_9SAUR